MSTEYATWMADESVRNSLGELQHILDNAAGCIDELSGPKVMITDGPLEDGYVVSGVYSIEHGAKPETGLFFTSTQVENMRRAVTTLTKSALEQALTQQRGEVEDEDYHVIMSMGRLLAEIAVILKGAEPAGTAWSYHDLPDLVKSAVENAHDIASEMRAWAAVKMRDRGSSRRDKMMVEEWSKRLLALPEVAFPVKDFDIPGLSITKEEIRFAIRKVVADRAFIGQDFGDTTPQPSADAVREIPDGMVLVPARMELTPENMETLTFMLGGDPDAKDVDERWNGGTLWVGETIGDNGEKYYGLNVANVECYEEGSVPIVEFAAAPAASGGESAAPVPYEQHEREILKVIDQRDHREVVIDRILDTVLGTDRPEWSSAYSFADAINDVADRMVDLDIKATKNIKPPSAASVSERARELRERADAHGGGVFVSIGDIRAIEQSMTQQRGEAAAWLIRDERGRVIDAVESEVKRDRLLNTGHGQLPQWTAEPLYAGSASLASAGTSWTHEDLKDLRERLVSAGISAHLNGDSNKASDRQFIRQAVTEAYGLIDDLLTTTPQPSADAVRELVERWRSNGHPYVSDCADELESMLSGGSHA